MNAAGRMGAGIGVKPDAYDPAANPELFEGVLARRFVAFVIDVIILAIPLIVVSVFIMMAVSSAVGRFTERRPTLKALALAFLILVGISLVGESVKVEIPQGYLYFAIAFSGAVEWINIRLRRRG